MPVIHVAGPRIDNVQRCARCRLALKDFRRDSEIDPFVGLLAPFQGGITYPEGALVIVGDGWQAMALDADAPTCEAR